MDNQSRCDFLQGNQTAALIGDRSARIAHVNEQVVQINHHIHQLIELRSTLLHRSNQLRSPFYTIPPEIISHIFQDVVQLIPDSRADKHAEFSRYADLHQSVVLSSVSRGFRQVALTTPQLWNRLNFVLYPAERIINNHLPLLQHCVSHISNLCLSVQLYFHPDSIVREKKVRLMTQALLSPGINNRIKHLVLYYAPRWLSENWLLSFPVLDTFLLYQGTFVDLKLEAPSISRISLDHRTLKSLIVPPYAQVLNLYDVSRDFVISISSQECPHPVKCSADRGCSTSNHPITLPHLKRLTWNAIDAVLLTICNLRLPSLEHLELCSLDQSSDGPMRIIQICEQVSATLTSLNLGGCAYLGDGRMRQICSLKFPHLEELKIHFSSANMTLEAIEALLFQAESENNVPEIKYMPNLRSLSLTTVDIISNRHHYSPRLSQFPRLFVDLLKLKRFGEASPFHVELNVRHHKGDDEFWPLELREELESMIRDRDLRLTRDGDKFKWKR